MINQHENPVSQANAQSLVMATTPQFVQKTVRFIAVLFFVVPFIMLFLPWQQNVTASGSVIALTPLERPQPVDAPLTGVIAKWHVQEGSVVKAGDLLLEMRDLDANFKKRLTQQRDLLSSKSEAKLAELNAYQLQLQSLQSVKAAKVSAAGFKLAIANQKVLSLTETVAATQATFDAATAQKTRLSRLFDEGLVSKRDLELAERDATVSARALSSAQANLSAAQSEVSSANAEIKQVENDAQASVNATTATINKIKSEVADNQGSLTSAQVNLARQSAQMIYAPRSGTVLSLQANGSSQLISQGQPLLTIVPQATNKAVELRVQSRDAPLIVPGNKVRLEFAGWPAMQITGWPKVAVGTFSGKVSFVDATDDGTGFFRIVVVPETAEKDWPSSRFLRQGVSAKGWILLEKVTIGFELWRVLNGFPARINHAVLANEVSNMQAK